MSCSFNCQLIAVKFDGDVLRAILLHVECMFVVITFLDFVIHFWRGTHGRRGYSILWSSCARSCWHAWHFLEAQSWHVKTRHLHTTHGRHTTHHTGHIT